MAMSTRAKWMAQCISDIFPSVSEYEALVSDFFQFSYTLSAILPWIQPNLPN